MIFRLYYKSRCIVHDKGAREAMVNQIIAHAAVKNKIGNITGALTFDGNDFAQILEGKKSDVLKLFATIQKDERHENVTIIKQSEVATRYYQNWGMKKLDSTNYDELVRIMID